MGEIRVPATARWGAQTQRALENFPISGQVVEPALLVALAMIKGAAATVNAEMGTIASDVAAAIAQAADEVAAGRHFSQFPIDVFQTGSGTSTNMNMNEVLANLASERLGREIRPNDEPNASQSSNDVFPSAIHLAVAREIVVDLIPALGQSGLGTAPQAGGVRRHREVRPHPSHGRDAGHARAGIRGICNCRRAWYRAPRICLAAYWRIAPRGHRSWDRD